MQPERPGQPAMPRPIKQMGQHFLTSEEPAAKAVDALSPDRCDTLIEVGPGKGILTKYLIHHPHFLAVELDGRCVQYLCELFPEDRHKIHRMDFNHMDLTKYPAPLSIIGNFPYNQTGNFLFKLYEKHDLIFQIVCMVQREVSSRIISEKGNKTYGILSVLLQRHFTIRLIATVGPEYFHPRPRVHSALLDLRHREPVEADDDRELFKKVVKRAFSHRRKKLHNNLSLPGGHQDKRLEKLLHLRAEQLDVDDFLFLTQFVKNHGSNL